MKKNREVIRNIVIDAMFLAFILLFTFVPHLGYIQVIPGVLTITTIYLFVLIAAALYGWKKGLLLGFIFGLSSLIKALTSGTGGDLFYINPFVSVLPRVLFGFLSGLIFDTVKKHTTQKTYFKLLPVLSLACTLMHSVLTLTCLYVFGFLDIFKISAALGLSSIIEGHTNFIAYLVFLSIQTLWGMLGEATAAFFIVPLAYFALRQVSSIKEEDNKKYKAIINEKEEKNDNII